MAGIVTNRSPGSQPNLQVSSRPIKNPGEGAGVYLRRGRRNFKSGGLLLPPSLYMTPSRKKKFQYFLMIALDYRKVTFVIFHGAFDIIIILMLESIRPPLYAPLLFPQYPYGLSETDGPCLKRQFRMLGEWLIDSVYVETLLDFNHSGADRWYTVCNTVYRRTVW